MGLKVNSIICPNQTCGRWSSSLGYSLLSVCPGWSGCRRFAWSSRSVWRLPLHSETPLLSKFQSVSPWRPQWIDCWC